MHRVPFSRRPRHWLGTRVCYALAIALVSALSLCTQAFAVDVTFRESIVMKDEFGNTLHGTRITTTTDRETRTTTEVFGTGKNHDQIRIKIVKIDHLDASKRVKSSQSTEEHIATNGDYPAQTMRERHIETEVVYHPDGGFSKTVSEHTYDGYFRKAVVTKTEHDSEGRIVSGERTIESPTSRSSVKEKYADGKWVAEATALTPVRPESTNSDADERAFLPETAGPHGQILATFNLPSTRTGADGQAVVAFVNLNGSRKSYRAQPDGDHHLIIDVPPGTVSVELFKGFKADGTPDDGVARCDVRPSAQVSNTERIAGVPARGPAIVRAGTAYERGGSGNGVVTLQTRGTDVTTRLNLDRSSHYLTTLAVSDTSLTARLSDDVPLGRHFLTLDTSEQFANEVPIDLVTLQADPIPPAESGSIVPLTVHIAGLPETDSATMDFQVAGAAELADGGEIKLGVPVVDNSAHVLVRGIRPGQAAVKFHLRAMINGKHT
ncbi:MAG: hypothetical protein NVSMB31_11850 [Vulcanimicrobiaceae bacterium]